MYIYGVWTVDVVCDHEEVTTETETVKTVNSKLRCAAREREQLPLYNPLHWVLVQSCCMHDEVLSPPACCVNWHQCAVSVYTRCLVCAPSWLPKPKKVCECSVKTVVVYGVSSLYRFQKFKSLFPALPACCMHMQILH